MKQPTAVSILGNPDYLTLNPQPSTASSPASHNRGVQGSLL